MRVAPAFLIAIMGCVSSPRPDVGNYVHNSYIDEVVYKYKAGQYDKEDLKNAFDAYREKLRMERLKLDVQEKELNDYSELFL